MTTLIRTLAAVGADTVLATSAFAQSASEVRGGSPCVAIENEPAAKLIVDLPASGPLARGLIYFHEVGKGGRFAAWEEPELFATELRAGFRSLR